MKRLHYIAAFDITIPDHYPIPEDENVKQSLQIGIGYFRTFHVGPEGAIGPIVLASRLATNPESTGGTQNRAV